MTFLASAESLEYGILLWCNYFSGRLPSDRSFIKKVTLAQVFSCKFFEISMNTFFTEHLRTTATTVDASIFWNLFT